MEPSTFQEGSGCQRRTVVSCRSVHSSLGKAGQQQTDCRRLQRRKTPRTRSSKACRNNYRCLLLEAGMRPGREARSFDNSVRPRGPCNRTCYFHPSPSCSDGNSPSSGLDLGRFYCNNVGLRLLMEVDSLYSAGCRLDIERRKKTGLESGGGLPRRECILEQDSRRKGSYWILAMIRPYLHRTRNSGLGTVWCNCQSMG